MIPSHTKRILHWSSVKGPNRCYWTCRRGSCLCSPSSRNDWARIKHLQKQENRTKTQNTDLSSGGNDGKKKGPKPKCHHSLMAFSCSPSAALTFPLISWTWGGSTLHLLCISLSIVPFLWFSWRFLFFYFFTRCRGDWWGLNWTWKGWTWFPFVYFLWTYF